MSASKKWVGAGVMGLAACILFAEANSALAVVSHDTHVAVDSTVDVATPVNVQAGPMLMDKMSKAIEQIERQVQRARGRSRAPEPMRCSRVSCSSQKIRIR